MPPRVRVYVRVCAFTHIYVYNNIIKIYKSIEIGGMGERTKTGPRKITAPIVQFSNILPVPVKSHLALTP